MIEMREVDARTEDSTTAVFRMFDLPAAQHDDLRGIVQQCEVDADLHGVQGAVVFRIQEPRMGIAHDRSPAVAAYRCPREFDDAVASELRRQVHRFRARKQHGVAEVHAGAPIRQHRGYEQALVDFHAAAIALQAPVFGGDRLRARHQARHHVGGAGDEMRNADGTRQPRGQDVIDGLHVTAEKPGAGLASGFENHGGRGALAFVAARGVRQPLDQSRRFQPKVRIPVQVRRKFSCAVGHDAVPLRRGVDGKPGRGEDAGSVSRGLAA